MPLEYHRLAAGRLSRLVLGTPEQPLGYAELPIPDRAARQVRSWETVTNPDAVVPALPERQMLPAIYFQFSGAPCEAALAPCGNLKPVAAAPGICQALRRTANAAAVAINRDLADAIL